MYAFSLMLFVGMSVSALVYAKHKLIISFKICSLFTSEKGKKKFLLPVAYFSYLEYACVISVFNNGSN